MKPNFLVVDDDVNCTDLLCTMLRGLGCEATPVQSGEEAVKIMGDAAQGEKYDAVFLDIMMPGLDGLAVLNYIRSLSYGADLPVLMLTAMDKAEQIVNGYLQGATYYITKPFTQEQVVYGLDLILGDEQGDQDPEQRRIPIHRID